MAEGDSGLGPVPGSPEDRLDKLEAEVRRLGGAIVPTPEPAPVLDLGRQAPAAAIKAVRAALPILDDDLSSFRSDTPPRLWDARGFVCLDDLSSTEHHRWKSCKATLTALAAIRDVLPPAEWEENTYAETQAAIDHFCGRDPRLPAENGPSGRQGSEANTSAGNPATEATTLCSDCPPVGYPTEETRCAPCPRRSPPPPHPIGNGNE